MAWSYSSVKSFEQCPKKYHHTRVLRDVKESQTDAIIYGNEVHKAAELYIANDEPIPPKFGFVERLLDVLKNKEGTKHCELKLGLRYGKNGLEPCGFFDNDVWFRGIVDLFVENGKDGLSIDYKTGKSARYSDTRQLDLMAAALFVHFPEVQKIKSALAFVVSNELVRKIHHRKELDTYINIFEDQLKRIDVAHETGVWNPISSPLCKFCPVAQCEHNPNN